MQQTPQTTHEEYEGVPLAVEVLGNGSTYGWIGRVGGAVIGGVIAAFNTAEGGPFTRRATETLAKLKINVSGKTAIIAGGALAGSIGGHLLGMLIGLGKAKSTLGKGRAQFERIITQRDDALTELANVKTQLEETRQKEAQAEPPKQPAAENTPAETIMGNARIESVGTAKETSAEFAHS